MSAQDLSFGEIITATELLAASGPIGDWWRGHEVGRIFDPDFQRDRAIIARAPSDSSEAGRLVIQLADEDAVHDREVRFGYGVLETAAEHHWDPDVRTIAEQLQALIFPDGVGLIGKSYAEEAGRGASRRAVLTPEVKAKLARFGIVTSEGGPGNLDGWMETHLQASSDRLSRLLAARTAATAAGAPTAMELLESKRRFVALMGQIFGTFRVLDGRLNESDRLKVKSAKKQWDDGVREATARAEARRARRTPVSPAPAV